MPNPNMSFQSSGNSVTERRSRSMAAVPASAVSPKSFQHMLPSQHLHLGGESTMHIASFVVKVAALEALRRFSKAKCPILWNSVQALQVIAFPPFKWLHRWTPLGFIIKGVQKVSTPLLFLSVTSALSDSKDNRKQAQRSQNSKQVCELPEKSPPLDSSAVGEPITEVVTENWMPQLLQELEKQGIVLPERINKDELIRYHDAANGDIQCLISLLKKTIRWRETFHILSLQELEKWSHLVFWHGFDINLRPCLVIRLGSAHSSLDPSERARFGQAIVSQIDHGIMHMISEEDPRITVLIDCKGLSPLRFPMQMIRSFSTVLIENYPSRLAVMFILNLPPVVRVIVQTFVQFLRASTREKMRFEGEGYQRTLAEFMQAVPACFGGKCACSRCEKPNSTPVLLTEEDSSSGFVQINPSEPSTTQGPFTVDVEPRTFHYCENVLRSAIAGLLMFLIFVAFLARTNDPESRPLNLP